MLQDRMKQFLLHRGISAHRATRTEDVASFVRLMRPLTTDRPLIRIGGERDGGYLVPDDLEGIRYCFSPGVSTTCSFELALAARGIESFMADYSVEGPPVSNPMLHFEKRYLGAHNDAVFMTLTDWLNRSVNRDSGDLILQMDIEGSEYDVIFDTPEEVWKRFRIVIVEFHHWNTAFTAMGLRMISLSLSKMLQIFDIVHIHPNNCCGSAKRDGLEIPVTVEITLLRKDRAARRELTRSFPHPLDRPNVADKPDLILPRCFYDH